MDEARQLATFTLGSLFFGVDVLNVQEVIRFQEMTRVPLAAHEIRGLINLRGQIVTAIDLRRRLGLEDRDPRERPMNVVVTGESDVVSLLVDEIGDVIQVDESRFELPPATLSEEIRSVLRGVYKLDGRLLLVLNIERASDVN